MNLLEKIGDILVVASDIIYSLSSGWLTGEEEPPTDYIKEDEDIC